MKLIYSCARDILLALEELLVCEEDEDDCLTPASVHFSTVRNHEFLSEYSKSDIAYCSEKLLEADYIEADIAESCSGIFDIIYFSITYDGHKYLDSVRHPELWNDILQQFKEKPVSMTFDIIQKLALKRAAKLLEIPEE